VANGCGLIVSPRTGRILGSPPNVTPMSTSKSSIDALQYVVSMLITPHVESSLNMELDEVKVMR
jgi:hypothetical protein